MTGNQLIRFCDEVDAQLGAIATQARAAADRAQQALVLLAELQRTIAEVRRNTFATSTTQVLPSPKDAARE